jgi:hypothetical protein
MYKDRTRKEDEGRRVFLETLGVEYDIIMP